MKLLFTIALVSLTTLLSAQVAFEPAHSIMDDNAVASADNSFVAEEAMMTVSNEFNLNFTANPVFGDITISYNLNASADVKLEIEKAGSTAFALVDGVQTTGAQEILWDENISSGKYTVRLIVGNKVQTKTINLGY